MASEEQIAANRRNAQKSTGPKTPEGKAAVRLNALQHGLYAAASVLPGEDQEAFNQLCANLQEEWAPANETERHLVAQLAVSEWTQVRLARALPKILEKFPDDPLKQFELQDKVGRSLSRLKRDYSRALKDLRDLFKLQQQSSQKAEAAKPQNKEPERQAAVSWNDAEGNIEIFSAPKFRAADGEWHIVPYAEWDFLKDVKGKVTIGPHIIKELEAEAARYKPPQNGN